MSEARFPNDQLLVTTDWVADHLDDPDVRIVEVTPPRGPPSASPAPA